MPESNPRISAQKRRISAQICRIFGAISRGKCKGLICLIDIRRSMFSLTIGSFKHTYRGLRSALVSLACPLVEDIDGRKRLSSRPGLIGRCQQLQRIANDF